jgi:SAM-dependent methyltransferase
MELLIGAGASRRKKLKRDSDEWSWAALTTLDINPDTDPDVIHDLRDLPLPFGNNTFDEVHAYEVLEHTGQQGDWRFFFEQWSEFWRVLKPGGLFLGTSPAPGSAWVWGDPGHSRAMTKEGFIFLNQLEYESQIDGKDKTPMSDYRFVYAADFQPLHLEYQGETFTYVLQAVKPSRAAALTLR